VDVCAAQGEVGVRENGATRVAARMTPFAALNDMSTNDRETQESVAASPSIAHSVCHDCEHEELYTAKRPEDAKQQAVDDAIEHGRDTGHEVDEALIVEPAAMATNGPDVQDTVVVRR